MKKAPPTDTRSPGRLLALRWVACAVILGGAGGCGGDYVVGSFDPASATSSSGTGGSTPTPIAPLVPAAGAWWGYHAASSSIPAFLAREAEVGRKFDVARHYHDFSNAPVHAFPTAEEESFASAGHILHISWEARVFKAGTFDTTLPAPAGTGAMSGDTYTYAQILAHELDAYLDVAAARVKSFGKPLFLDFDSAGDDSTAFGGGNVFRAAAGTPAEFAAAFRYIVTRFRAAGAANAVWVLSFAGYQGDDALYAALYPGDDVVDWIGWGPYNHTAGKWVEPFELFRRFYDRLDAGLLGAMAAAKPRAIIEYGCMSDARRPDWLRAIPGALAALPALGAVEYFDSGALDSFGADQAAIDAFTTAGHDTYVNPPHGD
jgi:hypothetical protein